MTYNKNIQPISGSNLSLAWANAITKCSEVSGGTLCPCIVSFPALSKGDLEVPAIREAAERELGGDLLSPIDTVANTIFPESVWLRSKGDRAQFFKKYEEMIPRIQKHSSNYRGIYFQRMIAYNGSKGVTINQLEHIINTWHLGNHRRSALQAAIFDPRVDHSDQRRPGFPCLQQIAFHPSGANGKDGLSVVAFYATQTLREKAYGNYLGLYRLGQFMAKEMGLTLKDVVCIASVLKLSNESSKSCCRPLIEKLKVELSNAGE